MERNECDCGWWWCEMFLYGFIALSWLLHELDVWRALNTTGLFTFPCRLRAFLKGVKVSYAHNWVKPFFLFVKTSTFYTLHNQIMTKTPWLFKSSVFLWACNACNSSGIILLMLINWRAMKSSFRYSPHRLQETMLYSTIKASQVNGIQSNDSSSNITSNFSITKTLPSKKLQ